MIVQLRKFGNSQGVLLPSAILRLLNIDATTPLEITTDGTGLIVKPIRGNP